MNIFNLLGYLVELYLWLIMFPMAILSWFRVQPGTSLARIQVFLYRATEPVLRPVRRVVRPIGNFDISFLIVFVVLQYVVVRVLFQ